jgi:hypothetical protein
MTMPLYGPLSPAALAAVFICLVGVFLIIVSLIVAVCILSFEIDRFKDRLENLEVANQYHHEPRNDI